MEGDECTGCGATKDFMEQIAAHPGTSFTLKFTRKYEGKTYTYEVMIPAGTVIDTSCQWYGPDKLVSLYPTFIY